MDKSQILLPEDVLYEVFKHLDGKSLKESALVCKR